MPKPKEPIIRMLLAYIGSKAVAPPNNTANKSSDIAPSIIGLLFIKDIPANKDFMLVGSDLKISFLIEI
ncbi:hypothetical protein B0I62_000394 [Clostridium beijerinckii]|nr:hypothetical protein [Clostridium beijerinckii]